MIRALMLTAAAAAVLPLGAQQIQPPKTTLKVGDMAPDFSLQSTDRKTVKLSEQRGHTVVLAFFTAAFTGG
jgi:peroxiredoxin